MHDTKHAVHPQTRTPEATAAGGKGGLGAHRRAVLVEVAVDRRHDAQERVGRAGAAGRSSRRPVPSAILPAGCAGCLGGSMCPPAERLARAGSRVASLLVLVGTVAPPRFERSLKSLAIASPGFVALLAIGKPTHGFCVLSRPFHASPALSVQLYCIAPSLPGVLTAESEQTRNLARARETPQVSLRVVQVTRHAQIPMR